jgi:hypothetical protein
MDTHHTHQENHLHPRQLLQSSTHIGQLGAFVHAKKHAPRPSIANDYRVHNSSTEPYILKNHYKLKTYKSSTRTTRRFCISHFTCMDSSGKPPPGFRQNSAAAFQSFTHAVNRPHHYWKVFFIIIKPRFDLVLFSMYPIWMKLSASFF